jgi:hypothetical protein
MEVRRAAIVAALVVVAALALGATAPASSDSSPAQRPAAEHPPAESVVFLQRVLGQIVRNEYARAWSTLNPAQRDAIARDDYVQCELLSPIVGHLDWINAMRVVGKPIVVAGGSGEKVLAQAVTFRLQISRRSPRSTEVVVHTAHAVAADGRWTWVLPAQRFALHRSGACLGGSR